jgi:hypothetical protein
MWLYRKGIPVEEKTMFDYNTHLIARAEHELMEQSLPKVYDFDTPALPEKRGWLGSRFARLRQMFRRDNPVETEHTLPASKPLIGSPR